MPSLKPFDERGDFRPAIGGMRSLAVRGAGVTVFSSALSLGIQIIATVTLARLIRPSDFGLVAMVTTFSLLFVNFGLNGFTEAVLQRDEIDHALASNLFWINFGVGIGLTVAFSAAGVVLARLYGEPRLILIAVAVSGTILITSLSVQHLALLKRAMRFSVVSANEILARAVSVAVSVVLGLAGWGYWALVAGTIAQPLTVTIGAWLKCHWIPGPPRRNVAGTGSMVRFALNIYGRFSVNYCARNMDNILVGWRFGAQSLGFYKKAYDLFALAASQLTAPLTNVAVAALSRLKSDSAEYRRYLLNSLAIMAFVGMGVGADLTLIGKDVIRLLLGPGWETAGYIFTFFGPGIGVMLLYGTHGWIHLSIGRADRWLRWGAIELAVTVLLFVLGLAFGPAGIAMAWTASFWLLTIPAFWYAGRPIHLGVQPVISAAWRYLVASVVASLATLLALQAFPSLAVAPGSLGALNRILVVSLMFGVFYLAGVILLHRGLRPIHQVLGLVQEMIPFGRFSRPSLPVPACAVEKS